MFFIRRCSPHLVSTMFFYGNKAHIQRFHHFLQLGPLPCDLKFLPIRGRGSPPHEYKLAHVTCFNQWDFNCCDKSRSPKCACMIELAVMSLSHCQEKNFPPMTTASSLWAPTKQTPADLSPNYSKLWTSSLKQRSWLEPQLTYDLFRHMNKKK